MENLSDTEQKIKAKLDDFIAANTVNKLIGNTAWTSGIKRILCDLGKKEGYSVCASGFKHQFEAEWMWDLIWYIEDGTGDSARLIDIPLVVECEWNASFKHIKYDFEKLLASNAKLRLMICNVHAKNKPSLLDYFKEAIAKYTLGKSGDRYMIAFLDIHDECFIYELIIKDSIIVHAQR